MPADQGQALPFTAQELSNVIATMEHLAKEARTPEEWVLSAENTARVAATLRALSQPKEGEATQAQQPINARALADAWERYAELFGMPPRGTEKQLAALIELYRGSPGGAPPPGEPTEPTPQQIEAGAAVEAQHYYHREWALLDEPAKAACRERVRAILDAAQFGPREKNDAR